MHITDKHVNKSDKPNYPSWQGSLYPTSKADFASVGDDLPLFFLEPVSLQTSRSVALHLQTNRALRSLGRDSLSLPQSEVLICSFYLCPLFWNISAWGKPFLGFCSAASTEPKLLVQFTVRAASPASYLWGFLWGSTLFLGLLPSSAQAFTQVISQEEFPGKNQSVALL